MTTVDNHVDIEAIAGAVDEDGLVGLTSALARFPSHIPDEGELGVFLHRQLMDFGCFDEVRLQPVVPGRFNVVAVLRGRGGGRNLLLNGHTDVPLPTGTWTRDPYSGTIEDGLVHGVGLTDMKGAIACMAHAGRALAHSDVDRRGDLVISAVIHHNVCGLGTRFFLSSWDQPLHAAINGEPTDLHIQVAHGGAWQFQITTRGRAAHLSRHGVNAITKMVRIVDALSVDKLTYDPTRMFEGLPRIVVGMIEGGIGPSRTAERCVAKGDVRLGPGMSEDSLRADFGRIVADLQAADPELVAEIDGLSYQRPFLMDRDAAVVGLVADAHAIVTGSGPPPVDDGLPVSSYVTDSSDLVKAGIPTAIYGPGDWRGEPDETIAVADLVTATRTYALAAARFLSAPAPASTD
ncbi:MAG TPA: M20/M25/M40 family metallo-hydrolase [Acidimicrobiales bacterium]|nr:M20/M25/M40 family metallo-hydrolase [Acidimicrobiales bacterium]